MKAVFNDSSELAITRVNRNISVNEEKKADSIYITVSASVSMDAVTAVAAEENCATVQIVRDGFDNIVYEGYTLEAVSENINDDSRDISIRLKKEIE